ncbi:MULTISPECIES: TatD family hydrolase [Rhodanobacter]|uniref:TatD family hydrolase n=1 Tax=Rhodanobacter TaxID=75309 RepID=UPI0004113099|nr:MULTISPECIES: TatD family hydrolase [Rhodanobacter]KZC19904.1 DNAase [Rhodanobacter denitrificans]UJJ49683.1 TatD family hydrolase [Rhodanobacter denitrificans]UJM92397.1 TatD family hydrolase [Rhodanobacter denitrificans]UJM95926.1 TatD family hydrolase [Rhodanobacter denitrificans]UJN21243.1 TatD family hydrolase [Rhodanobacter denitrificans]
MHEKRTRVPLVDSHVHLDDQAFAGDLEAVIERARQSGVDTLVVPAVDARSWLEIRQLCARHAGVHPAYGLHPLFLSQHAPEHVDALSSWLNENRPVAVGEIGLDFHRDDLDRELQRHCFWRQLQLAGEHDLPVIVHARSALEEVTLTLRRNSRLRGVVHSFSGSEQQARQLWDLGFHLGIGGPVTYERAQRLRRIVAQMPIEFLLLESDAPDQPGAAHRGERNEPAHVVEVLRCIAALRNAPEADIAAATSANARRLFRLN